MKRRKPRKSKGFRCFQRGECEPSPAEAEEIRLRKLSVQEFKEARIEAERKYNETPVATVGSGVRRGGFGVSRE